MKNMNSETKTFQSLSTSDDKRIYAAIDLKSFFASVECRERGLDPLLTNLVVADKERTEKTICLAVSPSLKAYGIPGRARLFEVVSKVKQVNAKRITCAPGHEFKGSSSHDPDVRKDDSLKLDFIIAPPRMSYYIDYSTRIYNIYLKYVSADDIHVYSIDEVFIDVTGYLKTYNMTARELVTTMIRDVMKNTGITATAGIGTNLYLCKIAMDIVAKHVNADKDGVRIAELDEMSYRRLLWNHTPITDFWRVGRGYANRLAQTGLYTMGDIARCSLGTDRDFYNEDLLYKMFGVNAELLIDHAWGYEPCTIEQIKAYRPSTKSISSGQVLHCAYDFDKAKLVCKEMIDQLTLELVDKGFVTDQVGIIVGYDVENLTDPQRRSEYKGPVVTDRYGREVPKAAQGNVNLKEPTSSTRIIMNSVCELFDKIVDKRLLIRRLNVVAANICFESEVVKKSEFVQMDLFADHDELFGNKKKDDSALEKEKNLQKALISIKKKYGKNAVLRGMDFEEGATMRDRNRQIGGHKA